MSDQTDEDKSNRTISYSCSICGRDVGRDNLRTKRVSFRDMGARGATVRSRVVAWLCIIPQPNGVPSCLDMDPDWLSPKFAASPGFVDTKMSKEGYVENAYE